jgi:streptogramin lyase
MSSVGGKGGGATSSSEFLRAYRQSVLTGANVSYQTIPKKAATISIDRVQRGVLADLSSYGVSDCGCPLVLDYLKYVSTTKIYTYVPPNSITGIIYANIGDLYLGSIASPTSIFTIDPDGSVTQPGVPYPGSPSSVNGLYQSLIDGNIYYTTNNANNTGVFGVITTLGYQNLAINLGSALPGLTQDNVGNFYVTNNAANVGSIYKISPGTWAVSTLVSNIGSCISITYATDGNLYFTRGQTGVIGVWRCSPISGVLKQIYSSTIFAVGIIQANDGLLYISQNNGSIVRMTLDGANVSIFVSGLPTGATRLIQGPDENLYVSSVGSGVYKIVVDGSISTPGENGPLQYEKTNLIASVATGAFNITYTNLGRLYFTLPTTSLVYSLSPVVGATPAQLTLTGISTPYGIMQSELNGNIYITNGGNGSIVQQTSTGFSYLCQPGRFTSGVRGITQDPSGNFYVCTNAVNGPLTKISPTGSTIWTTALRCYGAVYATDNNLYVTSFQSGVYRVNPITGVSTRIYITGSTPAGIIQANDGFLYFILQTTPVNQVIRLSFNGSSSIFTTIAGTATGITQGADENLYVNTNSSVYQIVVR